MIKNGSFILVYILTLSSFFCQGQDKKEAKVSPTNKSTELCNTIDLEKINTSVSYNDTIQGIKTLKEFYLKVYGNDTISNSSIEKLKRKFISERVLKRIDSLTEGDNLILDYDPFIQGQDYFGEVIKKSLKVKPLKNQNEYRVSFLLFGEKNEEEKNIDFLLKKDAKGNFVIYSIINDEYLNFNEPLVKKYQNENDIKGHWQTSCDSPFYLNINEMGKIFVLP